MIQIVAHRPGRVRGGGGRLGDLPACRGRQVMGFDHMMDEQVEVEAVKWLLCSLVGNETTNTCGCAARRIQDVGSGRPGVAGPDADVFYDQPTSCCVLNLWSPHRHDSRIKVRWLWIVRRAWVITAERKQKPDAFGRCRVWPLATCVVNRSHIHRYTHTPPPPLRVNTVWWMLMCCTCTQHV